MHLWRNRPLPLQLPNPLFWYVPGQGCGYDFTGSGANTGVRVTTVADQSGQDRHLRSQTSSAETANGWRLDQSRIVPGFTCLCKSDGWPSFTASAGLKSNVKPFGSRGLSVFFMVRKRKTGDINTPNDALTYLMELTGASSAQFYNAYTATGYNGFRQTLLGNGNAYSDPMAVAFSWDVLGFVIDAAGNVTFYENGYSSSVRPLAHSSTQYNQVTVGRNAADTGIPFEWGQMAGYQAVLGPGQVRDLTQYWFSLIGRQIPTISLAMYGDSIWAGTGVVNTTTGNLNNRTTAELVAMLDPRVRVNDMTQAGTQVRHATIWDQWDNNTSQSVPNGGSIPSANPKAGTLIHGSASQGGARYPNRISILEQGTNDVSGSATSYDVATMLPIYQACVTQLKSANSPVVAVSNIISRKWGSGIGWTNQAGLDAQHALQNADIAANATVAQGSGGYGADYFLDRRTSFPDWSDTSKFQSDGTHLTIAGMQQDAQLVANFIKTLVP